MFTKSIFEQSTNNVINENGLTLKCAYLDKSNHRLYNQTKDINALINATNILLTDQRVDMILDLIKESLNTITDQEVKSFNFYDERLLTACTVELKKTNAGLIMFNINEMDGRCVGIYGRLSLEERLPCIKSNNLPSLTCFKGFVEHGEYVGIVEQALRYNSLQVCSNFVLPHNLGLVVKLNGLDETTREYFENKYEGDFKCMKENGKVIFNIVSKGLVPFDEMIKDVCDHLNITLEELYNTRLQSDLFIEEQAKINKREEPYTGIDRLFQAYDKADNCVVYF